MNSNKVDIRLFAAILGFLFLIAGTAFATSSRTCRAEAETCCAESQARNTQCPGAQQTSRQDPVPINGSCCTTVASAPLHTSVAVVQQDSERDNRVVSDAAPSVVLNPEAPPVQSPFRGRLDLFDSRPRTSVAKYVLTSTFLI